MDKKRERYDIVAIGFAVMGIFMVGDYFSGDLPLWAMVLGEAIMILGITACVRLYIRGEEEEPSSNSH